MENKDIITEIEKLPAKEIILKTPEKRNVNLDVKEFLESAFEFRFNTVMQMVEFRKGGEVWRPFSNRDFDKVFSRFRINDIKVRKEDLKAIIHGELSDDYHPFKDYILGLPRYDEGKDYIREFSDMVILDESENREDFSENFRKWFVGLVACLIDDYVVNQQCFILSGEQSLFKTTWLNSIVPEPLRLDYLYSQSFDFRNKDHIKLLGQKILINLDELSSYDKTDVNLLKMTLTQDRVVVRMPYAAYDSHMWRTASFCGSTNMTDFLVDETGSRRFLVHRIRGIDIKPVNVSEMYAQAYHLYKTGFRYWFTRDDSVRINENNNRFFKTSIEEELITEWLTVPNENDYKAGINIRFMTTTGINSFLVQKANNRINMNESTTKRVGQILKKLGFTQSTQRVNGYPYPVKGYNVLLNENSYVKPSNDFV